MGKLANRFERPLRHHAGAVLAVAERRSSAALAHRGSDGSVAKEISAVPTLGIWRPNSMQVR